MRTVIITVITFFAFTLTHLQKPAFNHLAIYVNDPGPGSMMQNKQPIAVFQLQLISICYANL